MGGEITNQSGKGDKRIFQTLKEKSLDLRDRFKFCVNVKN